MKKQVLGMLGVVVVIVGLGWLLMRSSSPVENNNQPQKFAITDLVDSDTHMTGSTNAKVNIVEYGDYQCPACAMVHPTLKRVIEEYKSNPDFNFAFLNFPLSQHANARPSAYAAEAAAKQGKFWEMHDMIYDHQKDWENSKNASEIFERYAQELGLNVDQFKSDVGSSDVRAAVDNDLAAANRLRLNHTPSLFINGEGLDYLPTYDQLKKQVEDLLK
jgi:protein-disulfide isomerase